MAESKVTLHIEAKLGNLEKIKQIGKDLKAALGLSDVLADFDKLANKLEAIHTKIKAINDSGGAIFGRGTGAPAVRGAGIGGSSGGSSAAASAISAVSSQVSSAGARPGTRVLGSAAAVGSRHAAMAAEVERIRREGAQGTILLPESQLLSIGSRDPGRLARDINAGPVLPRGLSHFAPRQSFVGVPTNRALVRQAQSVYPGTQFQGTHIPGTHLPSIPQYSDPPPIGTDIMSSYAPRTVVTAADRARQRAHDRFEAAATKITPADRARERAHDKLMAFESAATRVFAVDRAAQRSEDAGTRVERTQAGVRRARAFAQEMAQTRVDFNIPERMARRRAALAGPPMFTGRVLGAGLLGGVAGAASMTRGILNEDPGAVLGGAGGMAGGALGFAMGGLPGGFTGGMIGAALGFGIGGVAGTLARKGAPAYQLEEQGFSPLAIQMGREVNLLQEDMFSIRARSVRRAGAQRIRQQERNKAQSLLGTQSSYGPGRPAPLDNVETPQPIATTSLGSSLRAVRNKLGFSVDQQVAMTSKMYGAAMAAPSSFNVNRQRTMMQLQRMGVDAGVTGKMMFSFARGQGAIQQRDTGDFNISSFANRMLTPGLTVGEQQGFFRQAGRFLGDEFMRTGISGVQTTTNVNQFVRPLAQDGGGFRAMQFGFGAVEGGRRIAQTGPQSPLDFALVSALAGETGSGGISPTSLLGAYQALETGKILDPSSDYHKRFQGYLQQLRRTGDPAFATFQMNKALQFAMPGLGLSATESITKMVMEGKPMDAVTKEMRKVSGTDTLGSLGTLGTTESMRRTAKLKDDMLRIGTEMIDSMLVFKEAAEQMAEALKDTAPALSSAYTKIAENAAQMSLE